MCFSLMSDSDFRAQQFYLLATARKNAYSNYRRQQAVRARFYGMKRTRADFNAGKPMWNAQRTNLYTWKPRKRLRTDTQAVVVPGYTRTGGAYARAKNNEVKYKDTSVGAATISTTLVRWADSINIVAQGDGQNERIGHKICLKKAMFRLRVNLLNQASATPSGATLRILIVLDKQCNGAVAAVADIITDADVYGFNNLDNTDRFVILKDKWVTVNPMTFASTGPTNALNEKFVKINIPLNIPINYNATASTGALATQRSNNILVCAASTSVNNVSLTGTYRIRYTDN